MLTRLFISVAVFFMALTLLAVDVQVVNAQKNAQQKVSYETYVVQRGDTLAKIAGKYCTTWQEVYELNRGAIGPNPNVLYVGTSLKVPNRCGSGGGSGGGSGENVYDRGPRTHANGTVSGNHYTVVRGDTVYSIAARFGITTNKLMRANGIANSRTLRTGQKLIIPGLVSGTPTPTPTPDPSVTPTPFISIASPTSNALLPPTFTASGRGAGLFEGNLVVQAIGSNGQVLVQKPTTLQGNNVGTGGEGSWTVELTVNVSAETRGSISAYSPDKSSIRTSVDVRFSPTRTTFKDFTPGECRVTPKQGAPSYVYPGGPQSGSFGASSTWDALRGAIEDGIYWYLIDTEPNTGNARVWVKNGDLANRTGTCTW
jgi:LysM repeat protein